MDGTRRGRQEQRSWLDGLRREAEERQRRLVEAERELAAALLQVNDLAQLGRQVAHLVALNTLLTESSQAQQTLIDAQADLLVTAMEALAELEQRVDAVEAGSVTKS